MKNCQTNSVQCKHRVNHIGNANIGTNIRQLVGMAFAFKEKTFHLAKDAFKKGNMDELQLEVTQTRGFLFNLFLYKMR